jgi:exopolysaccharide production protein ExoZ
MPTPERMAPRSSGGYIYGIDVVRFFCAVSVAAFHLTWLTPEIAWSMPFGWVGVEAFFVISGLVIANSAHGSSARQFLTSRFLRIYPALWCAAVINYPLYLWTGYAKPGHALQKLFHSVVLLPGACLATAYWTLPIELSFYLLVCFMIVIHVLKHTQWIAIILILWGAPYLIALALNASGVVHWPWIDFRYGWGNLFLFRHGPYFGLGILVWLFKEKRLTKIGIVAAGLALALAWMEIYARAVELLPDFPRAPHVPQTPLIHFANPTFVAFCLAFVAIVLSVQWNHRFPANNALRRVVRILGLTSYPLYLLHERVGVYVIFQMRKVGLSELACALVALFFTGVVSVLIAAYCEPGLRRFLLRIIPALNSATTKQVAESS